VYRQAVIVQVLTANWEVSDKLLEQEINDAIQAVPRGFDAWKRLPVVCWSMEYLQLGAATQDAAVYSIVPDILKPPNNRASTFACLDPKFLPLA
jgi:hypothetical protein